MKQIDVLIVEDNSKISRTHQAFVEKVDGFSVTGIANTIEEARIMVETLEPELILLDIYFPESNGIEFLKEIRGQGRNCDVILITAAREVEMLHNAIHGGAFDYMIKPVFFERFKESLSSYLNYRRKVEQRGNLSQDDADSIFRKFPGDSTIIQSDLPKGIDPVTMEKIMTYLHDNKELSFSASTMGEETGLSRTTARKYLEYLVATNHLKIDLDYGTKGRPVRKYRIA